MAVASPIKKDKTDPIYETGQLESQVETKLSYYSFPKNISFLSNYVWDILESLREHVSIPNTTAVMTYLLSYQNLAEKLPAVCDLVFREFGKNSVLYLEINHDPEIEDEHLKLYVRQEIYDDDIMKRIRKISKESNHQLRKVSGWIHITTDGQSPL